MFKMSLTFGTFARTASDRPLEDPVEDYEVRRDDTLTPSEAHVAWLAGAPVARVPDERGDDRFVSLLVPFL